MTFWVVLALVATAAAAGFAFAWWRQRRRTQEAEREAESHLDEFRREHTERVRRLERQIEEAEQTGHLDFAEDLLAVADALDQAAPDDREVDEMEREAESESTPDDDGLTRGVVLARREFRRVLEDHGIVRLAPERGAVFDPSSHEAIRAVDDTPVDADHVVACHRAGYRFEDRVIRPATVEVAVGSSTNSDGETPADSTEADEEVVLSAETGGESDAGEQEASVADGDEETDADERQVVPSPKEMEN